jgi:hypothetical protein
MKEAALKLGENVVQEYSFDMAHDEFTKTAEFEEILCAVKERDRSWSKIWFYDSSRISRSRLKAQTLKAFFKRNAIQLQLLKLPVTGNDPVDAAIEGIMESFDQLHSDLSKAGSIRGQQENIRKGYRAGGAAPFGYRLKQHVLGVNSEGKPVVKTSLDPDPETFPFAKEYFARRANGESRRSIFSTFAERQIAPPRGNFWHSSFGKSMEDNILVYQGHSVYNRHAEKDDKGYIGGKKYRDKSLWTIKQDTHERCITDEIANKILLQLEHNKKKGNNPGPKRYLLTDILFCSVCNSQMVGNSGFYACQNKMRQSKLCTNSNIKASFMDQNILKYLKDNLIQKRFYDKFLTAIRNEYERYKKDLLTENQRHSARLQEINKQIKKLMELYSRGKIRAEIVESQIDPLQKEKDDLEKISLDLSQVNVLLDAKLTEYTNESIQEQLNHFEQMLNDENVHEMRAMVRDFIKKIVLYPKAEPKGKKWKRRVHIESHVRALTMILLASPRGFLVYPSYKIRLKKTKLPA